MKLGIKKLLLILMVSILAIPIGVLFLFFVRSANQQDASGNHLNFSNKNSIHTFTNRLIDRELLYDIYVETSNNAFFFNEHFYLRKKGAFNSYRLQYYLKILSNIKNAEIEEGFIEKVKIFLDREFNRYSIYESELQDIFRLSNLESILNTPNNSDFYIELLEMRLNRNNGLFFDDYAEKLDVQIANTNIALHIFRNIGFMPYEFKAILYNSLSELILDSERFSLEIEQENLTRHVFMDGMLILESIKIFNELNTLLNIDLDLARSWFYLVSQKFVEHANNLNSPIMLLNTGLLRINYINEYFMFNLDYNKYIYYLMLLDWSEVLAFDIKTFHDGLVLISQKVGFFPEINYELSNYGILFLYTRTPYVNIREQYYGYRLAKTLGIDINTELFINTVKNNLDGNLVNVYYFLLILQAIDEKYEENVIVDYYRWFFNGLISGISYYSLSNLSNIYFFLYISLVYDFDISDNFVENLFSTQMDYLYESANQDEDLYYYALIHLMFDEWIDEDWIYDEIMSRFIEDRGFSITYAAEYININSTFRMAKLLNIFGRLNDKYVLNIPINEFRGVYGSYFIQSQETYRGLSAYLYALNLEAWYNGIRGYQYIKNTRLSFKGRLKSQLQHIFPNADVTSF